MEIYFKNDGTYRQEHVGLPVIVDMFPIGFIQDVTANQVSCMLFEQCIGNEYFEEEELAGIYITTKDWGFRNS